MIKKNEVISVYMYHIINLLLLLCFPQYKQYHHLTRYETELFHFRIIRHQFDEFRRQWPN